MIALSILPNYFDKYYGLASALLSAGRPIGTLVFAPLTQVRLRPLNLYKKPLKKGPCGDVVERTPVITYKMQKN